MESTTARTGNSWGWLRALSGKPAAGPAAALLLAVVVFSVTTESFLSVNNVSLLLSQAAVIGTLALGQTFIILTRGIDLANGAIAVAGTIVIAKLATSGAPPAAALIVGLVTCLVMGSISGVLVTHINLPPFIVTLGLLTVYTAATKLFSASKSFRVDDPLIIFLGNEFQLAGTWISYGAVLLFLLYGVSWYLLNQTAWGRHVFTLGDNPEAARLTGIKVRGTLFSVYAVAALCYGVAAWQALGRIPNADTNAYQMANLDSITAVVIGGTSLFGGRGGVAGTLVGVLIVTVLRNGLTQAGINNLYQDVVTGVLVIAAVILDQFARRRNS